MIGSGSGADVQRAVLRARDVRQARLDSCLARTGGRGCVITVSTAIPGVDKRPAGVERLIRTAAEMLAAPDPGELTGVAPRQIAGIEDVLGEFLLFTGAADARRMKERCIALESASPWGRLLDLDVYDGGGRPVSRHSLGLPERQCLVCDEAARDCARLGRHQDAELRNRVEELLRHLRSDLKPAEDPQRPVV